LGTRVFFVSDVSFLQQSAGLIIAFRHSPVMPGKYHLAASATLLLLTNCSMTISPDPQSTFMRQLADLCGKAFAGRLVSNESADANMAGVAMVMHVRECSDESIRIPFHVEGKDGSWDRSRTWIIARTASGFRLKHDHRHKDGSADKVTQYGGDTANAGTATRQSFVVDEDSIIMFRREGLPKSVTNIWAIEFTGAITPRSGFAYELRRTGENARFFRVEFDLTKPVALPPSPWGAS
jgi:hypothetical protein